MSKRIVICCDGTWNMPNQAYPTNVTTAARAILPTAPDGTSQVVFYDWGVGTERGLDRWLGGAFGTGLVKNVEDAYRFLVHNYDEGDDLFLFGFSRGAYTARSLVGLLRNCGLLHKARADRFTDAMELYRRPDDPPTSPDAQRFRAANSREVSIKFLGVWDTVGALGIPLRGLHRLTLRKHEFHDVELSSIVKHAYQALAIDERRWPFRPSVWKAQPKEGQTVEQVWFTGVHADVGGGYGTNGLSDAAFSWLLDKAGGQGLALDEQFVQAQIRPDPMSKLHDSRTGFYKLMRPHTRSIGATGGSTEAVHPGVVLRREQASPPYAPENLVAYLASPGRRTAGEEEEEELV